jgi:hypothetical protein
LIEGQTRRTVVTGIASIPLAWLAMFRGADLAAPGSACFTTPWDAARERLDGASGLRAMFAAYGDVLPFTRAVVESLDALRTAQGRVGEVRVSLAADEVAGEQSDPQAWTAALGEALDALDGSAPQPAPFRRPAQEAETFTAVEKIRRLRRDADIGIGEARALLAQHGGDLAAALDAIERDTSEEERARDRAGAFVAALVNPPPLPTRPAWQVLMEASGLEFGRPFPDVELLLGGGAPDDGDVRTHARMLGEAVYSGTVSWEPGFTLRRNRNA